MIVAGTLAGAGDLNVCLVILAAWAGAVIGDNISYGIGKFAGERTVKRLFSHPKALKGFDWAEKQLEERGSYIIIIARFIPFGRTAVTFTAGYTKGLPWHRFFRYDLVAGGLWATYATMLGYIGGKQFEEQPWKGVLLGLAIAFSVAFTSSGSGTAGRSERHPRRESARHGPRAAFSDASLTSWLPAQHGERVEIREEGDRELSRAVAPDVVIHTAYRQAGDGAREIVVEGTANVAAPRPRSGHGSSTSRRMSSSTAATGGRTSKRTLLHRARTTACEGRGRGRVARSAGRAARQDVAVVGGPGRRRSTSPPRDPGGDVLRRRDPVAGQVAISPPRCSARRC